jgi:6-methylsalicylate decarboxylase
LIDKVMYPSGPMPATDVHQHLWPEPLLRLLAARAGAPRLRRTGDGWELELSGEAPEVFDLRAHDPAARTALARRDGLERVLVAPSSPLGIESLPAAEAQPLLDAFHQGVHEVGGPFAPWGSLPLAAAEPAAVDALLDAGAPGLCLPASALAGERQLGRTGPVLERLAARGAPLLVHPGPAPPADATTPSWWPAMTSYVAEMQAAWLAARGGPAGAVHDELAWFDVSSYGPHAVDAMLRTIGVDRLVLGSDRPIADPPALAALGPAVRHAIAHVNPARILDA